MADVVFHVYWPTRADLEAGHYGSSQACSLPTPAWVETEEPLAGEVWFYLVSAANSAGEGILSLPTDRILRQPLSPCPATR